MQTNASIPVLITDDQAITRIGLRAILEQIPGVQVIGEAHNGQIAVDMAAQLNPAVIFMDISMPLLNGIKATQLIKENNSSIKVIMFTTDDNEENFLDSLSAGADAYCLKQSNKDQLAGAINAVMQGANWLDSGVAAHLLRDRKNSPSKTEKEHRFSFTKEQNDILQLVERGYSIERIAVQLKKPLSYLKLELRLILSRLHESDSGSISPHSTLVQLNNLFESVERTQPVKIPLGNLTGEILDGKYIVEGIIGEGGMSVVYRARHKVLNKTVAVKSLRFHLLNNSVVIQRLRNEANTASAINHPNIVGVHDFNVTEEGQPYLIMDFVEGETLEERILREKTLKPKVCVELLIQICDALSTLHSLKIIHRDLKSSNILLQKEGEKTTAKLADFGISKSLRLDESACRLTMNGEILGSPAFMSPEHCLGADLDERSDLYSLGCVLHQMLTGCVPFTADSALNMMWQQIHVNPSRMPFLTLENEVPPQLEAILFKLLHKDPSKRFKSADELKQEIVALL